MLPIFKHTERNVGVRGGPISIAIGLEALPGQLERVFEGFLQSRATRDQEVDKCLAHSNGLFRHGNCS